MKPTCLFVLIGLIATPSTLIAAQQEAERRQPVQELILTEVVYPQERGELQLTAGARFDNGRASDSTTVPVGVEYGLTDAWQVGLEWGAFTRVGSPGSAVTGTGDYSVDTKYSFMNIGGSRMHAAFGIEAGFARDVERRREVEPYAAFAADLNRRGVQVFGHVGLAFTAATDGDHEAGRELQWNAGALVPVGAMTFATELNVRNESFTVRHARELYVTPSITFSARRFWEFGVGVPVGVTSESNRVGLVVLMSYER
jgi:hypothetical protein